MKEVMLGRKKECVDEGDEAGRMKQRANKRDEDGEV